MIEASFKGVARAGKFTISVMVAGFANAWDIWVYPPERELAASSDFLVCTRWQDARAALLQGRKVLFHAYGCDGERTMQGKFEPVFWSPVWFPKSQPKTMGILCDPAHPLLRNFPTEIHSNWQWYHLMQHSRLFILNQTPAVYRPLVQVIDNFERNHKIGIVFEGRVDKGQLLVNGFDLKAGQGDPAVRCMQRSLLEYIASESFRPTQELAVENLDDWFGTSAAHGR